ncbi:MAG: hypothetical protein JRH12_25435, partial [Deltaproteobacteria bacterium]|nr:hypothetical protein [Deltaproteobacteria bacterium]
MCTHFSTKNPSRSRRFYLAAGLVLLALGLVLPAAAQAEVTADVVILDHVLVFNRLGAQNVNGMIYALARDVVVANAVTDLDVITAGQNGIVDTTAAATDVQVFPV